ncbi:unnamed protein product [marine sediment metagenome]|uniref:Uncharacterized protein n=1 Tax=marine sediment metagenome TaxID=412755 RepID=X1AHB0_9ZZZZ
MVVTDTLNKNVLGWVSLGVLIVVGSVVLIGFKNANPGSSICPGANASHSFYNSTLDLCCPTANTCGVANDTHGTSAISGTGTLIDNFVAGIAEPQNWVAIAIIAIIGFA